MIKKSSYRDGFFTKEAMGGMIFYIVMSAVVLGTIYMLFGTSKLSEMQQGLTAIHMQVRSLYSTSSSYAGVNNDIAIRAGAVPNKLVKGTALHNPWGGSITISPATDLGMFQIRLDGIPQEDCIKMATFQPNLWVSVSVNGNTFDTRSGVSQAATACSQTNSIIYTSR
jgi:type II secretory pathway pseudopilin PulG